MCAVLEDRGYRRDEIAKMTPWYAQHIIFAPRDETGEFRFLKPRPKPDADPFAQTREILFRRGWPRWRIDAKIEEIRRGVRQPAKQRRRS